MPKTAWGYVRLSQSGREASLDEQKRAIREYAREHDLALQTTRNEGEGTSGFDPTREEYQLLREKIRAAAIDAVVVRDRARLSRDFDDRLELLTEFRESGVEWHVVEAGGRLGLDDVQTAGMECIHAMMDHTKKMVEIERSRSAVQERLDAGYDHGPPRFGMEYGPDGHYQRPGENFELVEAVWRLNEAGATYGEIKAETGVPVGTAQRIVENKEWYLERAQKAGYGLGE